MNPSRPPIADPEKVQEEIVAYLDGELPSDDSRVVEERLAADPQFRDRLRQFERAWGLLDELPRPESDEQFAASTVEMVAIRAAGEAQVQRLEWPRQYLRSWLLSAVVVSLALLLGFGVVAGTAALLSRAGVVEDADAQLLADLGVLVNLDLYQQVDSLVLLHELDKSGLFSSTAPFELEPLEPRQPLSPPPPSDRTPQERADWVRALAPADKKDLAEKLERFKDLPSAVQQRMRTFDRELSAEPNTESLREVLARYCQWLVTLTPDQRMDLRALAPTAQLERVAKLREQDQQKLLRLRTKDLWTVVEWTERIAGRNEQRLLRSMLPRTRDEFRALSPAARRRRLMFVVYQQWQRHGFGHDPDVSSDEFNELKKRLSSGRREQMDRVTGPAEQWDVLISSLVADAKSKLPQDKRLQIEIGNDSPKRQWPSLVRMLIETRARQRAVSDDELWRFYHEKLTKQERESFKRLPRDEFMQQLRARYLRARKVERPEVHRGADDKLPHPSGSSSTQAPQEPGPHGQNRGDKPGVEPLAPPDPRRKGASEPDRRPPTPVTPQPSSPP